MGRAWGVSKGLVSMSRVEGRLNGETTTVGGFKHNLEGWLDDGFFAKTRGGVRE